MVVCATQKAIQAGSVTKCSDANNLTVCPSTPAPQLIGQQKGKGGGQGSGKGDGSMLKSGKPCFCRAFEGQCSELKCPHMHNKKAILTQRSSAGLEDCEKVRDLFGSVNVQGFSTHEMPGAMSLFTGM